MGVQLYPYVVLLMSLNIFTASCHEKGSLTFVIDNTLSMRDDIAQVKLSADAITKIVFEEKASQIQNMVLVTFNDPYAKVEFESEDRESFKRNVGNVYVHNRYRNWDCAEMSMAGILLALKKSLPGSFLYVFTDASAKDFHKSAEIKNLCQKKQSQIVFVLTGYCYGMHERGFQVYYDIAAACSGLAFFVNKNEVNSVLTTIQETIRGNKTAIAARKIPPKQYVDIPFEIDDHTEYAVVTASGVGVSLSVRGPTAGQERITWIPNVKVLRLNDPTPGTYVATVKGNTETSVYIVGRTDFIFSHGFSELEPKVLKDTTPQPIANAKTHLSISVTDPKHTVNILSAQILDDKDETVIKELPLKRIADDFYTTIPFEAPSQRFKVAVYGKAVRTGKFIRRIAKIPVTPQEPPKVLPKSKIPVVTISEGSSTAVEYGQTVKLTCKVSAFPEPKISWVDANGHRLNSNSSAVELPYDYISYLTITDVSKNDKYSCMVVNDVGTGSKSIEVIVKDPFKVVSAPKDTTELQYAKRGQLECNIKAAVPMHITWTYVDEKTGRKLPVPLDKCSVSGDGTILYINKMDLDMVGTYSCQATLDRDTQKSLTFNTRVTIGGLTHPKATGVAETKISQGSDAVIDCQITGVPTPAITWQFKGKSSSKYIPISGTDSKLHIAKAQEMLSGLYKCTAHNVVGTAKHVTTLTVQVPPTIISTSSDVHKAVEGKDTVLKIPCVATGLPKPHIMWKVNGVTVSPGGKYVIEDGTLVIKDPNVSDGKKYTCEAKNDAGSVHSTFQAIVYQLPKVTGDKAKKIIKGGLVNIECKVVKGVPEPTISWELKAEGSSKFVPIPETGHVLPVRGTTATLASQYKCVARNIVGTDEHVTVLTVQDIPKIISSSSDVFKSIEGKDAQLKIPCVATGLPKPVITWKVNGATISSGPKYLIEDGALVIKDPNVSDDQKYTCEATNDAGSVRSTFQAVVYQLPKVTGDKAKKIVKGGLVNIECKVVKGVPDPTISWELKAEGSSKFVPIPETGHVLPVRGTTATLASQYKCVARNIVGTDEHVTVLTVQDKPKIISSSSDVFKSIEGKDAQLKIPCVATGLPKPVITWKVNGATISSDAKYLIEDGVLIIRNPRVSDSQTYMCEATNAAGSVHATFHANILQVPKLSGKSELTTRKGESIDIECTIVNGVPKPAISWLFMDKASSTYVSIAGTSNVLHIANVHETQAGTYKCIARNGVGTAKHETKLTVEFAPIIISNHSMKYEGLEGDVALRIPCDVVGVPKPVITWIKDKTVITPDDRYSIIDGALIIKDPKESDSKPYKCKAKNYLGTDEATFEAKIFTDLTEYGPVEVVHVLKGSSTQLKCGSSDPHQRVRWFMEQNDLNLTANSFKLENVDVALDGNYTCRVSDMNKSYTKTFVVIVGYPPTFVYEQEDGTDFDWTGDEYDMLDCDAGQAKPAPDVVWTLNGKVLSEKSTRLDVAANWGHYTCNVSNVHGSIQKTFDVFSTQCIISRKPKNDHGVPLMLSTKLSWPVFDATTDYLKLEPGQTVTFSCPSNNGERNHFQKFTAQNEISASCDKQDEFVVNSKSYKITEIQCAHDVIPVIDTKHEKCLTDTSELMRVGYNVNGFLETYEVCFDTSKNIPLYSRVIMSKNNRGRAVTPSWQQYPGIGHPVDDKVYTCKSSKSSCCYNKIQLVNARDVSDGPAKTSTFIDPLNAVPYFSCAEGKSPWDSIESMVRLRLIVYPHFIAWTGTHMLQQNDDHVIPRYLWKVLRFDEEESIAIVYINAPKPLDTDILCKNICADDSVPWIREHNTHTYCCNVKEFLQAFGLSGTTIGEWSTS